MAGKTYYEIPPHMVCEVKFLPDIEDVTLILKTNGMRFHTKKSFFKDFDEYVKQVELYKKSVK